jgi:hypothetical protein
MKPRAVKLSKTFNDRPVEQIDYGEQRFGARVAEEKKERVLATIQNLLPIIRSLLFLFLRQTGAAQCVGERSAFFATRGR